MSGEQMFKRDRALQEQAVVIPADLAAAAVACLRRWDALDCAAALGLEVSDAVQ